MQQFSLWVALFEIKLTDARTQDNSIALARQNQTALFPNVDDQYWIGVQLNSQEVMPSTLASLSGMSVGINPYLKSQMAECICEQHFWPEGLCQIMPW
jgi:hypothetical protein